MTTQDAHRAVSGPTGAAEIHGWSSGRITAVSVTWVSYASYYLGRKGWSTAKATIESSLGTPALRGVETAYLISYALGQYASGWLGDRVGARWLIGYGMLLSAAACFGFGASSAGTFFVVAWLVNGLAQSTGWPGNIKAMAEWNPPEQRGAVMGVWSTCYQIGGIVATNIAVRFLQAWGWEAAFYGPAIIIAIVGILVLVLLRPGPLAHTAAVPTPAKPAPPTNLNVARRGLLRSPTVWCYGMSYFCLKLIRYSLLFWLAYYFETVLHYEKVLANDVSTAFEWGGVAGAITIGLISDRLRWLPRSAVAAIFIVGLAGGFWLMRFVGTGVLPNVLCLALIGFLLFGPDTLLSGAAAQDAGGAEAAALAAGLINGIGSMGAIFQEAVTVSVSAAYGWNALFSLFMVLSLISALCLVPTFRRSAP